MAGPDAERSTVSLRAAAGQPTAAPLADAATRRTVVASAHALAERTGVRMVALEADETGLTATIEGPMVVALGFAAELRRTTDAWHRGKYGTRLWGDGT